VTDDDRLAAELAIAAGDLLMALRADLGFDDPRALRAEGDRRSHELLVDLLARRRPADAVLSEEGKDDPARLAADRVWIVDPLDGTREYGEEGRTDWAVHVALWAAGELAAGAIALPAAGAVLATGGPLPERPPPGAAPRVVVSRTRAPDWVAALAGELGGELVPMGSAGAKIAAVVVGDADVYVHAGGQYEWDSAAPVAVAAAAGLHCSRLDGSPLRYNQPDPLLPDLVVCWPDLADDVLARLPL
jgi:3'(2'), 5'-bisphosphate nucleotidase